MEGIERTAIERLMGKGLEKNTIPAFVRNLLNTIDLNPQITLKEINKRMATLGWGELDLDDHTLQLVLASFEHGAALKDLNSSQKKVPAH